MRNNTLTKQEIRSLEMIGFMFLNLGVLNKAELTINAILVIDPNNYWAKYSKPILYFLKEDYESAVYCADHVLHLGYMGYDLLEIKKVKARALFKLKRNEESSQLINEIKQEIESREKSDSNTEKSDTDNS